MRSSRLKNFCQVCRKQCKDQNGYHCHLNSIHHQRKIRQFATNPQQHIEKYSKQLQTRIVQMLKVKYPGVPKDAQQIYDEYAEEKHHVKFNFTQWKNLQEFVNHLKDTAKNIKVTGKFPNTNLTYTINKASDFMSQKKEEKLFNKRQNEKQEAERSLQKKMEKTKDLEESMFKRMKQKLKREQEMHEERSLDQIQLKFEVKEESQAKRNPLFNISELQAQADEYKQEKSKGKKKNADVLFERLEKKTKQKVQNNSQNEEEDDDEWIIEGILVKIIPHEIPEAFHGKKVQVVKIKEPFVAQVMVGNVKLEIDQTYLQTVIPKINNKVKVVRGQKRGLQGTLKNVDIQNGLGIIEIEQKQNEFSFNEFSKV